ncbi:MAG: F0F1 ATP synthase subunit B [Saprospiraceae bacterium]
MIFLAEFSVITPEIGLLFWTTIIFLVVWFLLGKTAFGPIAKALKNREESIDNALQAAETARKDMAALAAKGDELAKQAQEERASIIQEAKEQKAKMIEEARDEAKAEASKIITSASDEIERQKRAAMTDVKNQAGALALQIAEQVIRKQLAGNTEQEAFVSELVKDIKLN